MARISIEPFEQDCAERLKSSPGGHFWGLLAGVLVTLTAGAAEVPNALSLANTYPLEKLKQILPPRGTWHPFPVSAERAEWGDLREDLQKELIKQGEEALETPLPPLPASLYLEYRREGNRSRFEAVYFKRRGLLQNLVLAECVEGKGRFLDTAANALWSICEESTWCLPAHVGVQKAGVGLPDVTEPIVDLFAAETGVTMAWSLYLIGKELEKVSPQVPRRAELELARRILAPVNERSFGWMALNVTSAEHRPNNWTPWIAASVLTVALLSDADEARRLQVVHKMMKSLDGFLRFHPADGSCDEGPGYWGHAGGSLLDALELLHGATKGKIDVFGEPLVQEIGKFIYRAHVCGDYFVPVGDCAAKFEPERGVIFRYGKRINDANLKALAAEGATVESLVAGRFMGRALNGVFSAREILQGSIGAAAALVRDVWLGSEEMQLLTTRSESGSCKGLYLAAWGGHNAQSHNHNDVGNFIVFLDGQPIFVDPGAPTYTAQTFSSRRYEIWAMQSAYHNLPTINGAMQSAGRQFAAREVRCETNIDFAQLTMDIAAAYPAPAKVKRWLRNVRLDRGRDVEISDSFELGENLGPTSLNLITPLTPEEPKPGIIRLRKSLQTRTVGVRLDYPAQLLSAKVERIELTDARLAHSWGPCLYRIVLSARSPALKGEWKLCLSQEK